MKTLPILIIDDMEITRVGIGLVLEEIGLKTEEAIDGMDGLIKIQSHQYAGIILDCNMPEMSGYECARQIRLYEKAEGKSRTPILGFTTCGANDATVKACLAAGMDDCLSKSCTNDELKKVVERLISNHQTN